jgi:hypothetical protein
VVQDTFYIAAAEGGLAIARAGGGVAYIPLWLRQPTLTPTRTPTPTPTPTLRPPEEKRFDDDSAEWPLRNPGETAAVRFTVDGPYQVTAIKCYLRTPTANVRLIIYDGAWNERYSTSLTPTISNPQGQWFTWTLPGAGVAVAGDFYVALQWPEDAPGPELGVDEDGEQFRRSHLGTSVPLPQFPDDGNFMIRAVVR